MGYNGGNRKLYSGYKGYSNARFNKSLNAIFPKQRKHRYSSRSKASSGYYVDTSGDFEPSRGVNWWKIIGYTILGVVIIFWGFPLFLVLAVLLGLGKK